MATRCLRAFSKRSLRSPADEVAGVSGSEAVKAFRKIGYEFDEQHGSHMILRHNEPPHNACRFPTIRNWPKKRFGRCSGRLGLQWKSSHGSRRSRADGDRGKAVYQRLKDPKSI